MKHLRNIVGACFSAALLAACGDGSPSSSAPLSVAPQIAAQLGPSRAGPSTALRMTTLEGSQVRPAYGVIYSFKGYPYDGANPEVALINVMGKLYGTTNAGGEFANGTTFAIATSDKETFLYSFNDKDGASPTASLVDVKSALYGTTTSGGKYSYGTAFAISSSGTETLLHSFGSGSDGASPSAKLIDANGTLYGTTTSGGKNDKGTIFAISPSHKETVVHSFGGAGNGALPTAGLIDVKGTLYGTTENGGKNCIAYGGCGTVFELRTDGGYEVLYSFAGGSDGAYPHAGLVNVNGTLFGTTLNGGGSSCGYNQGCGTVFKINLRSGKEAVLYSFKGNTDGEYPYAGLLSVDGRLYGTTEYGGEYGYGTVFSIASSGKEKVLHSFGASSGEGKYPLGGLIELNGRLYGTTEYGGAYSCYGGGCGAVFSLSP
jgi:uncharacterized repeat protein (TIGR03803 family)